MTEPAIQWDDEALKRIEKIPAMVRNMAKSKIEKAALAAGEERVTVAFLDANKARLMG